MAYDILALRKRIEAARVKRAQLEERRTLAQEALEEATARLKELGLKPKTARAELDAEENDILKELKAVEEQLGIA